jgi:S1-C subfamily serine protease
MGVSLTADLARVMNLNADQKGILIESLERGSPADVAGLEGSYKTTVVSGEWWLTGGDVILAANGMPVQTMEALVAIVREMRPGQRLVLGILRNGEPKEVPITLGIRPMSGL